MDVFIFIGLLVMFSTVAFGTQLLGNDNGINRMNLDGTIRPKHGATAPTGKKRWVLPIRIR